MQFSYCVKGPLEWPASSGNGSGGGGSTPGAVDMLLRWFFVTKFQDHGAALVADGR